MFLEIDKEQKVVSGLIIRPPIIDTRNTASKIDSHEQRVLLHFHDYRKL